MTKIFQIDSHSGVGGGQKVLFDLVKELRNKFRFAVVAPPGVFLQKFSNLGIKVNTLSRSPLFSNIKMIRKLIREESPEIVHAHGTRAASWTRFAVVGLRPRPKIIYTLHGFHIVRRNIAVRKILLFLERFLNRWTDVLSCVSDSDRELILKHRTISEDKIIVIKNGINTHKFQLNHDLVEAKKRELKLSDSFILTAIGRLHHPKDFSTVLKALRKVRHELKNVRLLIIGDGPLRESLEKETKSLGLLEHVKFLGFRKDIPTLIEISDIVILSSRWEGLPLVLLEAAAARKATIGSEVDGIKETIIDGKTGYLFKLESEKDLADKILKLAESQSLRERIGNNAFEFVSKTFSKEKMIENYEKLYLSLL